MDVYTAIERPVIARLAHHVEDEVALNMVAAAKAIIEVDACTRAVVAHVVDERCATRNGLEVAARLLAIYSNVVHVTKKS